MDFPTESELVELETQIAEISKKLNTYRDAFPDVMSFMMISSALYGAQLEFRDIIGRAAWLDSRKK